MASCPNSCRTIGSPAGNGILELLTFLGIIFGIAAAGLLAETFAGHQGWSGLVLATLAVCGWACSRGICRLPAAKPGLRAAHQSRSPT
jgi:hypothetical protein